MQEVVHGDQEPIIPFMDRVREHFTTEEVAQMDRVLQIVGQELMPEVTLK